MSLPRRLFSATSKSQQNEISRDKYSNNVSLPPPRHLTFRHKTRPPAHPSSSPPLSLPPPQKKKDESERKRKKKESLPVPFFSQSLVLQILPNIKKARRSLYGEKQKTRLEQRDVPTLALYRNGCPGGSNTRKK